MENDILEPVPSAASAFNCSLSSANSNCNCKLGASAMSLVCGSNSPMIRSKSISKRTVSWKG
jgi:hypothetical protein